MDKKKTKKETPKKDGKHSTKKVEAKAPKKAAVKKTKPVALKSRKAAAPKPAPHAVTKQWAEVPVAPAGATAAIETPVQPAVELRARQKIKEEKTVSGPQLRLRWVRSAIGTPERQKLVVRGLGFRHLNEIIVRPDTPMIRGMVKKIPHLVEVVE